MIIILLLALLQEPQYAVIDFGAEWCIPCKQMETHWRDPKIVEAIQSYAEVYYLDYDRDAEAKEDWKIKAVPTIIVIEKKSDGWHEVRRHVGYMSIEQLAKFLELL